MAVFMIMTALNVFNLKYELDTVKKFPENLPSRVGYEIVESKYNNGELAPSTLLLESENTLSDEQIDQFLKKLENYEEIDSVRLAGITEDSKAAKLSAALTMNPYSTKAIDILKSSRARPTPFLTSCLFGAMFTTATSQPN
ncbi:hypothetical protein M4D81_20240 [Paenibacillus sp. p3-SID867]|uniref:hypothetical protein n=1 Tax=Paenibacillus sp. p3-SID867 TaxID=2916363 RepID=UPI0021A73073|nr:hypothetical protein [Paenibacillus sp. p3-SID867]MCT1401355.1 hypothetical protein [Paenibacillus sp. p3-SID867]